MGHTFTGVLKSAGVEHVNVASTRAITESAQGTRPSATITCNTDIGCALDDSPNETRQLTLAAARWAAVAALFKAKVMMQAAVATIAGRHVLCILIAQFWIGVRRGVSFSSRRSQNTPSAPMIPPPPPPPPCSGCSGAFHLLFSKIMLLFCFTLVQDSANYEAAACSSAPLLLHNHRAPQLRF
jgi:hypothetical protein